MIGYSVGVYLHTYVKQIIYFFCIVHPLLKRGGGGTGGGLSFLFSFLFFVQAGSLHTTYLTIWEICESIILFAYLLRLLLLHGYYYSPPKVKNYYPPSSRSIIQLHGRSIKSFCFGSSHQGYHEGLRKEYKKKKRQKRRMKYRCCCCLVGNI